jgi:hypothetical protein
MVPARRVLPVCCAAFVAAGIVVALPSSASAQPARDAASKPAVTGSGTIAGRLLVAGEREYPVRRARVTLESDALAEPLIGDSDTDGRFRFAQLPPGTYRVRAEKPGFVTWSYGARHAYDPGQPIQLAAAATRAADISLPRGAALEGRIVNQEGDGIANLVVSACRLTYGPYGKQAAVIKETRTDDLGRYRVHSLPAGDYLVQAAPDPIDAVTQRQAPGATRPPGNARTYYPGTANLAEATRVTMSAGRDAASLDFAAIPVPMAQLTLTVVDSSGKAPSVFATRVQRVGSPPGEVRGMLTKNQAVFPAVPAGDFWVMAAATPSPGAVPEFALARVSVAGSNVEATLPTQPGAALSGRVVVADSATAAVPTGLRVHTETVGFELPNPAGSSAQAPPDPAVAPDGSFALKSVFGPTLFRLTGVPGGWALAAVRLGESDVTDQPIDLAALEPPTAGTLAIVVTNATGELSGTAIAAGQASGLPNSGAVAQASGLPRAQPVPNARIVVFPEDERQWRPDSRLVKSVLADADGKFSVASLLPGRYLVSAAAWMDAGAWLDPDTLRRLRDTAQHVVIEARGKTSVTIPTGGDR